MEYTLLGGDRRPSERYAAVAVVLWPYAGSSRLLMVKRANNPSDPWSGDWALPGGRKEPRDASLYGTARRETLEETGIDLSSGADFLFEMDYHLPWFMPWIKVKPFVFRLRKLKKVVLSQELENYSWPLLKKLNPELDERNRPVYYFRRGEIIWGMTARIITDLKQELRKREFNWAT